MQEETADTLTFGFIYQPEFIEGLSISWDYWDIEIENAIQALTGQNIADYCFVASNLNDQYCSLLSRNDDPNSAQFGGFNFMRSISINLPKVETNGFDFSVSYDFAYEEHKFNTKLQGTRVHKIDLFTNPNNISFVDPELKEVNRPELAGNIYFTWNWNDLTIATQSQFMDEQLLRFVEIEQQFLYGDVVMQDPQWIHDLSASYNFNDNMQLYGGIKNLTEEEPFITDFSFPVSPRGRYFFIGFNYKI